MGATAFRSLPAGSVRIVSSGGKLFCGLQFRRFGERRSPLAVRTCLALGDVYHWSASIIPLIVISTVFYGIYNIFTTGISIQRKTWFAVVFTALSALVNIGFNLVLIPMYGSMGAALSTLLAYMLLAFVAYVVNQRLYPVPYEIGLFVIELLVGIAFYAGSSVLAPRQGGYVAFGISLGTLVLYGGCLLLLGRWLSTSYKN